MRPLLWRSIALVQWVQAASDASAVDVIRMLGAVQFTDVYERVEVLYVPQPEYVLLTVPGVAAPVRFGYCNANRIASRTAVVRSHRLYVVVV